MSGTPNVNVSHSELHRCPLINKPEPVQKDMSASGENRRENEAASGQLFATVTGFWLVNVEEVFGHSYG